MSGLAPCPFCGGQAHVKRNKTVLVSCTECGATTFQSLGDQSSAVVAWNRRAPLPAEQPSNPVPLNDEHRRARKAIQDVIAQLQVLHEGRDPIMAAIITTVALLVDDDLQTVADFLGADTGERIVGQQTKGGGLC